MKKVLIVLNIAQLCYVAGIIIALSKIAKGQMPEPFWLAVILIFNIVSANVLYKKAKEENIKYMIFWLMFWHTIIYIVLVVLWTLICSIKYELPVFLR